MNGMILSEIGVTFIFMYYIVTYKDTVHLENEVSFLLAPYMVVLGTNQVKRLNFTKCIDKLFRVW